MTPSAILAAGCLILNFSLLSGFCSVQRSELKGDSVCGAADALIRRSQFSFPYHLASSSFQQCGFLQTLVAQPEPVAFISSAKQ